jgi:hypothetical protein
MEAWKQGGRTDKSSICCNLIIQGVSWKVHAYEDYKNTYFNAIRTFISLLPNTCPDKGKTNLQHQNNSLDWKKGYNNLDGREITDFLLCSKVYDFISKLQQQNIQNSRLYISRRLLVETTV